uniref:Uncharacterized protein n=1 Tax=Moniliophthora roreri TaxID=221103 RepID=A0A0W0FY04_MONRR
MSFEHVPPPTPILRTSSMKDWNVAGEFIILKNITMGSNSLLLVLKAAFY